MTSLQSGSETFLRGRLLGEGTWGVVYQGTRSSDGLLVAIKRIKPKETHLGLDFTALREIKYLRALKSPYVVDVSFV